MPARIWTESHDSRISERLCTVRLYYNTHLREFCDEFGFICVLHFAISARAVFSNLFSILYFFFF